ncbi:23S rRNA (uracil(1939)-C(5))-methyltransferase RlmD [archaeon BMS3Abin16]|nr:23S rRNA (uracil(1939)-C(5))-methyltransferase RlmD [archaeon BMS3Abin16]HDY74828.1 class I SAM-dependent methyltransferase family protein [Euryarchaeota archaeon]
MSSSKQASRRNLSVKGLQAALADKLDLRLSGWEILGGVMVVRLDLGYSESEKSLIGETIVRLHPTAVTVVNRTSIDDELREPVTEVIAGSTTESIHVENGCMYRIDPTQVMFSFGNKEERKRMAKISSPKETVVDMFACVGQFTLPLAKHSRPEKMYAVEKNPVAFRFLKENIAQNKLSNVEPLLGDCRDVCPTGVADRVLMGYLFDTHLFLPTAINALNEHGILHYHFNCTDEKLECEIQRILDLALKHAVSANVSKTVQIKSYAPKMYHWVLDIDIEK